MDWDSCGYEVRTSQQSQLLTAGEHPVHTQPLRLATHSTSATVAPPRTKGPFSMIWQILPREECWTIIHGWLHTSLRVSRPSGANYLGARACPSLGSPTQAVLTLRACTLITAGYLRREALYFTKCHPVYFWYRLTSEQRLGFKALYKKRCKCHVSGLLSLFSLQSRHWWLSHVLVSRALSLLSPSMDDPCSLTFLLFPGRLLPQFPSCSLPPSLFPLASTCIQTLVFLGWGCEQEWVAGGNKPWVSLHL